MNSNYTRGSLWLSTFICERVQIYGLFSEHEVKLFDCLGKLGQKNSYSLSDIVFVLIFGYEQLMYFKNFTTG